MDWSLYEKRVNINGNSNREQVINLAKENLASKILDSPALKKTLVNGVEQMLIINSTKKASEKTFNTLPGEIINIGDSIAWNSMHWLVTEVDFDDEITRKGKIIQCNLEIKWQNLVTFEIISRWCFAERPYANGIDEGNVISVPDRQFRIKLPYDKETVQIDIGRRFILETISGIPRTYKLLMPDLVTSKFQDSDGGFIVWNLEFNSIADPKKDNLELGVCDYHSPDSPVPPIEPDITLLKCEIIGSSSIKCGGSARSYKPVFYLADGLSQDNSVVPAWAVDAAPEYADKIISTSNGNLITLKCANGDDLIGKTIKLTLTDALGIYQPCEKQIDCVVM